MQKISKKRLIINSIIIIIVTGLSIFYLFKNKTISWDTFKEISWWQYLVAFTFYTLVFLLWGTIDHLVYKTFTDKVTLGINFTNTILGHLGSSVTPMRSGHFPLMGYYLHAKGLTIDETVKGFTKCQIIYSFTTLVVYIGIFIYFIINKETILWQEKDIPLWIVVGVGLLFHSLVFGAIILLSFNKSLLGFVLKLLAKIISIFKKNFDKENFIEKGNKRFDIYQQEIKSITKNITKFILPCLLYVIFIFTLGSVQYISYMLISKQSFNLSVLFKFYCLNLAATYITNIIPLPGGVGTSEMMFTLVFSAVIANEIIGSVLILWRVTIYYLPIVFEAIIYLIFSIRYNKKIIETEKQKLLQDEVQVLSN